MGWGEAHRPPPRTRADLARELAAALEFDIPEDMTAEASWPMLIAKVRIRTRLFKESTHA